MATLGLSARTAPVVLLAFDADGLRAELEAALRQAGALTAQTRGEELGRAVEDLRPDVVFLGSSGGALQESIRAIRAVAPSAAVVVAHATPDANAILESVRAGASDCVYPPFASEAPAALQRAISGRSPARNGGGKVIAFLSAKGGCGATTLACHTAAAIRALRSEAVLLADLDLGCGNVGFLLKATNHHTILDAARNIERLDASFWKALVSSRAGLDVVSAPGPGGDMVWPDAGRFRSLLEFARSLYPWIVVDLGRGLGPSVSAVLPQLDELCLVATPDPLALAQCRRLSELLGEAGGGRLRTRLVLNRLPSRSEVRAPEIARALGLPLAAALRDGEAELARAIEAAAPVSARSPLGKDVALLARALATVVQPAAPVKEPHSALLPAPVVGHLLRDPAAAVAALNTESYIDLSETCFQLGRTCDALLFLNQAVAELEELGDELRLGRTLNRLGVSLCRAEHWAEAERAFKRARGILERTLGPRHPEVAACLSNLATVLRVTGQAAHALALYQESLAICEAALGPEDPAVAWNLDGIAELQCEAGQQLSALFAFRRSLAIKRRVFGDTHWDVAVTLGKLGDFYFRQQRYTEAEPLFWRSLEIRKAVLGEAAPGLAGEYSKLGRLFLAQRKFIDANRLFRFTLGLLASKPEFDFQGIRANLEHLAESYRGLAQFAKAEETSALSDAFVNSGEKKRRRLAEGFLPELRHIPQPSTGVSARWAHADLY